MNNENVIVYFSEREQTNFDGMVGWFKTVGIILLVVGLLAVILSHIATLTVQVFIGLILLISGITHMAHALQARKWRNVTWEMLVAALFLVGGILFMVYPLGGAVALTLLLGFFFLILGGFKIPFALAWRRRPGWGWIMASGILSAMLGLVILFGLPGTAAWVIGLLLGIDLIFSGVTLMTLSAKMKSVSGKP